MTRLYANKHKTTNEAVIPARAVSEKPQYILVFKMKKRKKITAKNGTVHNELQCGK